MTVSVGINQCHALGQQQMWPCFLSITPVDVVFGSVIVLNWQTKAGVGRTELCDGFRFLCREWEDFSAFCKLRNITAYFFFFFHLSQYWKQFARDWFWCYAALWIQRHLIFEPEMECLCKSEPNCHFLHWTAPHHCSCRRMPYCRWLWQLRWAPAEMTVSTCCGKQAGPGDPIRAKLQATAWTTAGLDSTNLPWQMTVCICFRCETTALIELGTHQEITFLSRTCLLTFPWRHAEVQNF